MRARDKVAELCKKIVSSNLTPQKMALTVALGVAIGILPVLWGTTLLCAAAAWVFRLNQACMQVINYLAYPLQLVLLLPFYRFGEKLFPSTMSMTVAARRESFMSTLNHAGQATFKAILAWSLIAPVLAALLYMVLLPVFRRKILARAF